MNKVYMGLGSNVGDRIENIKSAFNFFKWDDRFHTVETSSLYESSPYGNKEQQNFINCAVTFETKIDIHALLNVVKELERRIGRIKRDHWAPREIDIDILFYGDLVLIEDDLTIPHKDFANRDFVLVPLIELDEGLVDPLSHKKLISFLSELNEKYIIKKINVNLD